MNYSFFRTDAAYDTSLKNPPLCAYHAMDGERLIVSATLYGTVLIMPRTMFKAIGLAIVGESPATASLVSYVAEEVLEQGLAAVLLTHGPDGDLLRGLDFVPLWSEKGGFLWVRSLVDGVTFTKQTQAPVVVPEWRF